MTSFIDPLNDGKARLDKNSELEHVSVALVLYGKILYMILGHYRYNAWHPIWIRSSNITKEIFYIEWNTRLKVKIIILPLNWECILFPLFEMHFLKKPQILTYNGVSDIYSILSAISLSHFFTRHKVLNGFFRHCHSEWVFTVHFQMEFNMIFIKHDSLMMSNSFKIHFKICGLSLNRFKSSWPYRPSPSITVYFDLN